MRDELLQTAATTGRIPGPEGYPWIGAMPLLRKDPLRFLLDTVREYGDVVALGGPTSQKYYFVNDPQDLERIYKTDHRNYVRGANFQLLADFIGQGLFLAENDFWRRQRRLMQPAFHSHRLATMGAAIHRSTEDLVERWGAVARSGKALDIEPDISFLALEIAVKTLFGSEVREHAAVVRRAVGVILEHLYGRVWSLATLPSWVPTPANRRFLAAVHAIDRVVYEIIAARRKSGESGGDVMSMLLALRDEETGEEMTDRQVRDEVVTLLVAGHETTAICIAWTLYLLSKYPQAERQVHEELEAALEGRAPEISDFAKLPYLGMVLKESLRLYPPFWMFTRSPLSDVELGGYRLRAGSILIASPYVTHRHTGYWDNPEAFEPERFLPERSVGRPLFAYYPFSHGPRVCIGQRLAEVECTLVLARILQCFRLELMPGSRVEPNPTISLGPKGGVWMTLRERPRLAAAA
jgi:cytochrome P450